MINHKYGTTDTKQTKLGNSNVKRKLAYKNYLFLGNRCYNIFPSSNKDVKTLCYFTEAKFYLFFSHRNLITSLLMN